MTLIVGAQEETDEDVKATLIWSMRWNAAGYSPLSCPRFLRRFTTRAWKIKKASPKRVNLRLCNGSY